VNRLRPAPIRGSSVKRMNAAPLRRVALTSAEEGMCAQLGTPGRSHDIGYRAECGCARSRAPAIAMRCRA
jgi:hypothetical protein